MVNAVAKYQKYAEYKDSGVEWLGKIPSHWHLFSLKRAIDKCTNGFWGAEPDGINDLCVLRVADFDRDNFNINLDKLTYRSVLPKEAENRFLKKGDLLIEKSGGGEKTLVGCVVQFNEDFDAITSNFVAKMTPNKNMESRFLTYAFAHLYAGRVNYPAIKQTTGIQNLDSEAYLMENFCFPSLIEQTQIANFLDHETAKIDSLIEKQQKLIELLKEKRQAVISHAVTKGLDPDVPMKDSGVEWLGKVPKHWKVIKLKHLTTLFEQGWSPQCDSRPAESNEYGVLKVGCVNGGKFRPSENKALPPELEPKLQYLIQRNDLLISRANTKELVGSAAVIDDDYPNLILCDKLYRIRFNQNVCAEMVALYLSIGVVREQIELGASGASHSMQNIGQDTIKELFYLLQPIDEAQNILMNIIESNKQFDSLISKAESAIQLLQERRTALISSVITGKIDVRHWQNPQQDLAV